MYLDRTFFSFKQEEVAIIERKTPKDLIASIKDGRYKEQSMRLLLLLVLVL